MSWKMPKISTILIGLLLLVSILLQYTPLGLKLNEVFLDDNYCGYYMELRSMDDEPLLQQCHLQCMQRSSCTYNYNTTIYENESKYCICGGTQERINFYAIITKDDEDRIRQPNMVTTEIVYNESEIFID